MKVLALNLNGHESDYYNHSIKAMSVLVLKNFNRPLSEKVLYDLSKSAVIDLFSEGEFIFPKLNIKVIIK